VHQALVISLLSLLHIACTDASTETAAHPPKDKRTLLTDQQIYLARSNCANHPGAARVASAIIGNADKWLQWSDRDLLGLVTTADVPRAFNVSTAGCPVHGKDIYKSGTYPWIVDPKVPFKIKCPIGGEVYPDNDYASFYDSNFKDRQYLNGKYSDDGWGWPGPDGQRYWFVGYANHWMWRDHVLPAVGDLSRAYVLTAKTSYAHKAVILLDRIAQVYPDMDYHNQSRYGSLQKASGNRYEGKILSHIWETSTLRDLAESYDSIWETIDSDVDAHKLLGKSARDIRTNIETNLLEQGIRACFSGQISGNFGMHQNALIYAVLARQYGDKDKWLGEVLNNAGSDLSHLGINYALYNFVYRDGLPFETSPAYNWLWVENLTSIADMLKPTDINLYDDYKMRLLFDGMLSIRNVNRYDPSVGDSGTVYGKAYGDNSVAWNSAWHNYEDDRYLGRASGFVDYRSLFLPALPANKPAAAPQSSRLLDGYGMAILNNPKNTISLALYYGLRGGHGHYDRLNFELFASGYPMMPDLGYPDFMNAYVSGIYTWSKNTISHNTVTVDAKRQSQNLPGTVKLFADSGFARTVDIDASDTYPQCSTYRRQVIMVDLDRANSYFVDIFTITGARQHDYSLHGPVGDFHISGGSWRRQTGTLAGRDVSVDQIYDNPVMASKNYKGGYDNYSGSGFQHLFDIERLSSGPWFAEWTHQKDKNAGLRIRLIEDHRYDVMLAKAQVSPIRQKELLNYIIVRHSGDSDLKSRFVSIIEPFQSEPTIKSVEMISATGADCTAVSVKLNSGESDLILRGPSRAETEVKEYDLATDAQCLVLRRDPKGAPSKLFITNATYARLPDHEFTIPSPIKGEVLSVSPDARQITIRLDNDPNELKEITPGLLKGAIAHFSNSLKMTAHPIERVKYADGKLILTTKDVLLVGKGRIKSIAKDTVHTDTVFKFADTYKGAFLADTGFRAYHEIAGVSRGKVDLVHLPDATESLHTGDDFWVVDIGPDDKMSIDLAYSINIAPPRP
jgi:hypothetical protein